MGYVILVLSLILLVFISVLSISAIKSGRRGMKESKEFEPQKAIVFGVELPVKTKAVYWLASLIHRLCGLYIAIVIGGISLLVLFALVVGVINSWGS